MTTTKETSETGEKKTGPTLHTVHPHSRHARQDRRKVARDAFRAKLRMNEGAARRALWDISDWFQSNLVPGKEGYSDSDVSRMIEQYLREKLQKVESTTPQRQRFHETRTTHSDLSKIAVEKERQQFEMYGLRAPDLTSKRVVVALQEWEGEYKQLDVNPEHDVKAIVFKMFPAPKAISDIARDPEMSALDEKARLFTTAPQP